MEIFEAMGVSSDNIFCSSLEDRGIPIGKDWKDWLHSELHDNTFVVFLLSENFYHSPICLCEMGAAWILSQEHAPILIPPLKYDDLKGVINSQGFMINEPLKWSKLREAMRFTDSNVTWERKRDSIIERINALIS